MSDPKLEQCYRILKLSPEALPAEVEEAYRKLLYQFARGTDVRSKQKLQQIKAAYQQIRDHLDALPPAPKPPPVSTAPLASDPAPTSSPDPSTESPVPPPVAVNPQMLRQIKLGNTQPLEALLNDRLRSRGWRAQVTMEGDRVQIHLSSPRAIAAPTATAVIYTILKELQIPGISEVEVSALQGSRSLWTQQVRLIQQQGPFNRFSFDNPWVNACAYPVALVLAALINASPFSILLLPLYIWIHEFGHATVAWAAGRRALPLPFGWTSVIPDRTWWVYVGILFLLGVLVWHSWRERLRWPIVLAGAIAVIQFYMTWIMDRWQFEMWLSFGGIGGEFYLSTLLMICFYFKFPDRWRWDFWRFVILMIAAATFFDSFWLWHHIDRGLADVPWGSIFGGAGDSNGDMNRLNGEFGWSVTQIVDTYTSLGKICLLTLIGTYGVFLVKLNPQVWYGIRQKGIAWLAGDK